MEPSSNKKLTEETVAFSVDAGIINRLGRELVGRAETAVSELVKNSYDADATNVRLYFINTEIEGGTLEVIDDGNGMTKSQLLDGFMRLSSSDKIHNPISPVFERVRAGKKGIGRFATQRLGTRLTILTKTQDSSFGYKLDIDWSRYETDINLESIQNPISEIDVDFIKGTKLIISDLREAWWDVHIKRVYRYVSELLQPTFLSKESKELHIANSPKEGDFNTFFYKQSSNNTPEIIADFNTMVLSNALGIIEGSVTSGKGECKVVSKRFEVNDNIEVEGDFDKINNVHFKVYYFIYTYEWYEGFIPKMEYNKIYDFSTTNGGVKLYRNGFRVLPYGEIGNDWLNIDKRSVKAPENAYVPFNNPNFFGFVEIIDQNGENFEETSSREGLIENESFKQLTDFVFLSLRSASQRINSARFKAKTDTKKKTGTKNKKSTKEKLRDLKTDNEESNNVIDEAILQLEEIEMLRVLAGIGLNIAEFTHEIRQFIPSFNGSIDFLQSLNLPIDAKESLLNLQENFNRFKSYTSYIDHTLAQTASREKSPIKIHSTIQTFYNIIRKDLESENIIFNETGYGFDIYTLPMHPSEWISIFYNLYTNAKKAIKRAKPEEKKIQIIYGVEDEKVYLEFMDNGDGVPAENRERIFDAFFTTSLPSRAEASQNESVTGTGLGLKIVKDIINAYEGEIYLTQAEPGYSTSFRIEIQEANDEQKEKYGN